MSTSSTQKVLNYYHSLESKLGYTRITWKTKHFGFYPDGKKTISEKQAQVLMQEQVAKNLRLKPGQRILDAGCGYGTTAQYLTKKYGVHITGIDINEHEIADAKLQTSLQQLDGLAAFDVQDYSKTSFPSNYFDGVYTVETLSHSPNVLRTLQEFYRTLKPGGKLVLLEYTLAPDNHFSKDEIKQLDRGVVGTAALGLKSFRHDQFPNIISKAGFIQIHEQNITKNFMPSLERLKKIAQFPYFFVNLLNLHRYFVNTAVAVEWHGLVKKDLIRYCIFTANK